MTHQLASNMPPTPHTENAAFAEWLRPLAPALRPISLLSVLIGLLAIVPTGFAMKLYDSATLSGSLQKLSLPVCGVFLALGAELLLRHIRQRKLAQLDGLPDFFSSSQGMALFELPLVIFYITVIAVFAGWLALVPATLVLAFTFVLKRLSAEIRARKHEALQVAARKQAFIAETLGKQQAVRLAGLETAWQQRFQHLSAGFAYANHKAALATQKLEAACFMLTAIGKLVTLAMGAHMVIGGSLTAGGLFATLLLVWRISAQLQASCESLTTPFPQISYKSA